MHAGICHVFVQNAEAFLPVFGLCFLLQIIKLYDLATHAFERCPPTHQIAVNPIIIFTLTFKARNLNNRVAKQNLLLKCPVCSHQKQGLMLKVLLSEKPQSHYPMHTVQRSTAQL